MINPRSQKLIGSFLTAEARAAVVRIREPSAGPDSIFSGFFITDQGHLVTAFHAVKSHAFDRPCEFEVQLEFDIDQDDFRPRQVVTTIARCAENWCDPVADWAVLQVDMRPASFLPLSTARLFDRPGGPLGATLRVYGFTATEQGLPCLGLLTGEYLRSSPAKRRFHVAFLVRSRGQSGGPVIDLASCTVVGSVVGFRHDEKLTADVAAIDQDVFAAIGCDLRHLALQWRMRATIYLCVNHPEFADVAVRQTVPNIPACHVSGREDAREILNALTEGGESRIFLHGPPGSGKTVLATEVARALRVDGQVDSIFWYDFEDHAHRSADNLLRRLAAYLLYDSESFEAFYACLSDDFVRDTAEALNAVITALRERRHVLVFDNLQFGLRDDRGALAALLERISSAVVGSGSKVICASWDPPDSARYRVYTVTGFTVSDVRRLVKLHHVDISAEALAWVSRLATDITCVEAFVRSPAWRGQIEAGRVQSGEPVELHQYWVRRFLASVSDAGRRILLTMAVLAGPCPRELVEGVAQISRFASTLDELLTSPPLVRFDNDRYSLHFNVARAILAVSDRSEINTTHRRAATVYRQRGDFLAAARHDFYAGNELAALELLFRTRDEIVAAGGVQQLEALAEDVRRLTKDRGEVSYLVHAILASCRNIRGEYRAAAQHWNFALLRMGTSPHAATFHNRKGDSHRLASDYAAARAEYEQASLLAGQQTGEDSYREGGRAQLGLAKLDRLACAYERSQIHYLGARDAFEALFDEAGMIEAVFGLGEVSRLMADWDNAISSYQESLSKASATMNLERQAYALWGLGEVHRLLGDFARAKENHEQGLELCRQVADTRSEGWALLGLAETARAAQIPGDLAFYEQARNRFTQTGSTTEYAHATLGIAESHRAAGDTDLTRYEQVLSIYESRGLRHCLVMCRLSYAAALRVAKRHQEADVQLTAASELAADCSLALELSWAESMRAAPDSAPYVQLNFP